MGVWHFITLGITVSNNSGPHQMVEVKYIYNSKESIRAPYPAESTKKTLGCYYCYHCLSELSRVQILNIIIFWTTLFCLHFFYYWTNNHLKQCTLNIFARLFSLVCLHLNGLLDCEVYNLQYGAIFLLNCVLLYLILHLFMIFVKVFLTWFSEHIY